MGLSLCGGIGRNAVAVGGATNANALTMTLLRDVPCPCVVHIIGGQLSTAPHSPGGISGATDSVGGTYTSVTSTLAVLGAVNQVYGASREILLGPTALRAVAANELHAGDTITVNWAFDSGGTNNRVIALALALTGVGTLALPLDGPDYGDGVAYPDFGTSTDLKYADVFVGGTLPGAHTGQDYALLSAIMTKGATTNITPAEGVAIGDHSTTDFFDGDLNLAVSAIPFCANGSSHDPGWSWTNPADAAAVNYQLVELAQAGIAFDGGWTHRVD